MTYEKDYTISEELMEEICEQGLDALPELMRIVLNAAMYIERQKHIGAGPYIVSDLVKEKVDFEMLMLTSPPSVC